MPFNEKIFYYMKVRKILIKRCPWYPSKIKIKTYKIKDDVAHTYLYVFIVTYTLYPPPGSRTQISLEPWACTGPSTVSSISSGEHQRMRKYAEPDLSLVPDRRLPPKGVSPRLLPVQRSFT